MFREVVTLTTMAINRAINDIKGISIGLSLLSFRHSMQAGLLRDQYSDRQSATRAPAAAANPAV